ncbi:hypothetical protein [Halobacillus naozhouensis]|uniref:Uncharacterized protein n=1 Tax=Halobacillus naozhouensis TaxID=554880 RepID=A0ABY8IWB9_9BACI|nr:hypothetical protein [Halobacillus naozhouensis]WFT74519.1 hypothetical protein P9989_19545 [Halobacillus naozhouensis]
MRKGLLAGLGIILLFFMGWLQPAAELESYAAESADEPVELMASIDAEMKAIPSSQSTTVPICKSGFPLPFLMHNPALREMSIADKFSFKRLYISEPLRCVDVMKY